MKSTYQLFLLLFIVVIATACQKELAATKLKATSVENALGLSVNDIRFEWRANQAEGSQVAYQVLVASDAEKLSADLGDLWDSGKRFSPKQDSVLYRGLPFEAGRKIWWKVKLWGPNEEEGVFSRPASFQLAAASAPSNRIVLLGGTLISSMEKYAYFESAITSRWPHHSIIFRNLGWPGDDVFGTARSQFGSAQNTKSWQPPSAEEGFGFETLRKQVADAKPETMIIAYGSEAAYFEEEADFKLFEQGYQALITYLDSLGAKLILLSPPRQEKFNATSPEPKQKNERLERATQFIQEMAKTGGYHFINLFEKLIPASAEDQLTENGIHLSAKGHQRFASLLLTELGLTINNGFRLQLNEEGLLSAAEGGLIDGYQKTGRGIRFNFKPDMLYTSADIFAPGTYRVRLNGQIHDQLTGEATLNGLPDSLQYEKLRKTIMEKNRLHRYRINPLNSAYIFLFRQHEMGHLAYEMDDFDRLVEEQERLIANLCQTTPQLYEVELLSAWKSPREYPDHEVPKNIPAPDIVAELNAFTIDEGFEINLFAADPMIANPINLSWDTRGRAWVSTSSTYPHIKPGQEPNDKIIILEDTDQDGVADKSTVFAEGLFVPHSVMPVKGGAYVCASTELLFLADTDGDDVADESRVVYAGFGNADVHHMIHGLRWSPWGDLYFTQSIYINSFIDTPYGNRRLNGSGIWEFRPETERLEVFARGMVNPWGHAFDAWGQAIATDGAGGNGPHYLFPESAHQTAVGAERVLGGMLSGKPKNTAAEFVSGRHMPSAWEGDLISNDYRVNRTIRYKLKESGSGYTAEEMETLVHSSHRSYRPVDIKMGPDGALYIVDWYNPIIDHGEVDFHHPSRDRSHGRIWRLTVKNKPLVKRPTIYGAPIPDLLELLKAPEEYTRVQANRELANRNCPPETLNKWVAQLNRSDARYEHHRLEGLWLGFALNAPNEDLLKAILTSNDHHARAAAVRMLGRLSKPALQAELLANIIHDKHPQVRLEAVNALRKLKSMQAVEITLSALDYPTDDNLDYAIWLTANTLQDQWLPLAKAGERLFEGKIDRLAYALIAANNKEAMALLTPLVKEGKLSEKDQKSAALLMARLGDEEQLDWVLSLALEHDDMAYLQALASAPATNTAIPLHTEKLGALLEHSDVAIRLVSARLIGRWKLSGQKDKLLQRLENDQLNTRERLSMADALVQIGDSLLVQQLALAAPNMTTRAMASAAWAKNNLAGALENAVAILSQIESEEGANAIFSAYTRSESGPALLAGALEGKALASSIAVTGTRAVQSSGRDLPDLVAALTKAGGLSSIGMELDENQRTALLKEAVENGNVGRGRQIFQRESLLCTSCHMVDGKGGKIGPDLSSVGAYMTPESLLESILNPGTDIKQGYETINLTQKDGTIISGTLHRKTNDATLIRDAEGTILSIPNEAVAKLENIPISLMPKGLTASLRPDELVDLMSYLTNLGKTEGSIQ